MPARLTRGALALVFGLVLCAETARAQTPFVPYFGKNKIKYDDFKWHIYTTEHFEIYYYPEFEQHLERLASYAESAYQHVSSDLKHDLAVKVPLVLYKTHSEFEQTNLYPGYLPEGIAAFAEPVRDRMVLPIDEPPDRLYGLIVHELTHIFEFDIIPRSLIRRGIPLWVDEGLADYMRGEWVPIDLMTVRDAAVADIVPKMSELEDYGDFRNPRLVYNLGHAAFEFIESRWGKEGIRQFLFSLRKNVIGGGDDAYQEALRLSPEDFDQQFEKYIKERFKPFRDRERPVDYGKNLAPNPDKTKFIQAFSIEPSPSGELIAAFTGNRKDQELDIVLISAKDGQIVRNLTTGFDQDRGFEYIVQPGGSRSNTVPWMSWSPLGDRLAYFVRTEKTKSLVMQNVLSRKIETRIGLRSVDEPESPDISADGRQVAFSALKNGVGDIYLLNVDTQQITNVTADDFADYSPTFSPDGKYLIYLARISGNQKLFRLDLDSRKKTQLTFGTHDEGGAQFIDDETIIFSSTATDPTQVVEPEVAKNGNIFNLWTLNLKNGSLRQFTDALGGNFSPVVLKEAGGKKVAFLSYFKNEYSLHSMELKEGLRTASTSDFGTPAPIIDFQPPLTHTLVTANRKKKGTFEKLFLDGRPPVNVGVTSGGDFFGGGAITFSDVLADQQFTMFAASIAQYRTLSFSYANLAKRFQYAAQGFSQTQFYYGPLTGAIDEFVILDRDRAIATRTVRGGVAFGIYPLNRYYRLELSGGFVQFSEEFNDPSFEFFADLNQQARFGRTLSTNGSLIPLTISLVQETTIFRQFGPLAGNTFQVSYEYAPEVAGSLSRQTFDFDARHYQKLGGASLLALRMRGFKSWGDFPTFLYFGGNSEMRGYRYLEFVGDQAVFANAELRFPLIDAMLTPLGVLGGIRGTFFANIGGASFEGQDFKFFSRSNELYRPLISFTQSPTNPFLLEEVRGAPVPVSGFRLRDSRASYGIGLETFALGFPIHFDWSWRTLFNKQWEDVLFFSAGGSSAFRKTRFDVWIGYDF